MLFGITEKHEAVTNNKQNKIVSVVFDVGGKKRSENKVKGKKKCKSIVLKFQYNID